MLGNMLFIGISFFLVSNLNAVEICAPTLNTSWVYSASKIAFEKSQRHEEVYCDSQLAFPGANIELELLGKNGKVLFKKYERLNFKHLSHSSEKKQKRDVVVENWEDFKIIKIPAFKGIEGAQRFRIKRFPAQSERKFILAEGEFKP